MSQTIATNTNNELLKFISTTLNSSATYITKVQFMKIMTELLRFLDTKGLVIEYKDAAFTITVADRNKIFICLGDEAYDVTINTTGMVDGDNFGIIQGDGEQKTIISTTTIAEPDEQVITEKQWAPISILIATINSVKTIILGGRTAA